MLGHTSIFHSAATRTWPVLHDMPASTHTSALVSSFYSAVRWMENVVVVKSPPYSTVLWVMMIIQRIRGKVLIRTILCCIVYHIVPNHLHCTNGKLRHVGLGLVYSVCAFFLNYGQIVTVYFVCFLVVVTLLVNTNVFNCLKSLQNDLLCVWLGGMFCIIRSGVCQASTWYTAMAGNVWSLSMVSDLQKWR